MPKKKGMKALFLACILMLVAVMAAACGGGDKGSSQSTSGQAEAGKEADAGGEKKVLKVGTDAAYPPFEKLGPDSKPVGFDMDIIKAVAEANGWEVQIEHAGWDPLFEDIEQGKRDIAISCITINEKRKKKYDFSDPYFDAYQLIMVPESANVTKVEDIKNMRVGVQSGTTGAALAEKILGKGNTRLKGLDDTPSAVEELYAKRVDAVVGDNGVLTDFLKNSGKAGYKVVKDPNVVPEQYGIMVKKGNKELLDGINKGLKTIKENGKYDEIFKQYFGEEKK
ncbi:basic amino acid ABC transporter substrate-binding protein [Aneurinibacillus aneurinilyticus]|jgi:polar amino acid transport system substrate-binding protein|uniref:basic amino acid ABC transporter substrate-binding protein n=1 Tax=Aneurinibacillus aneurinilyticus TaxID=1391 RepID=UPI0023F7A92C|nr:basic amino acid ABC transporter substrate-binding protein [Aneurinibacillus aneurinilyticus]MCI1693953.1 basic amino acid ABC transporter substrate-binding protein [Aneurinibacillus aneurinilyticus]